MALTSLQVCMDSADWLQGTITDESGMDSSSPSGDMLTCSRPLVERKLRPQQDQGLNCPRCDSTHTKFCYYNNYSLSQPRYFCKTCRRYWTKGGTLRNIPVGGGCRKNKKVSSKKSNDQSVNNQAQRSSSSSLFPNNPTDLHLSLQEVQLSHLNNFLSNHVGLTSSDFMGTILENNARPVDFMESKYEALVGSFRNNDFTGMSDHDLNMIGGFGEMNHCLTPNFNFHCSPFGMSTLEGDNRTLMDSRQRLMLPYDGNNEDQNAIDVKPYTKLLCLEWQDQVCSDALNGLGLMAPAGYTSSATTHYYS